MEKQYLLKKTVILTIFIAIGFLLSSLIVSADLDHCDLDASLVNQDTDPVLPGEYVEVVFQISGLDDPDCDGATVKLIPEYPFTLKPGELPTRSLAGPTYIKNNKKIWNIAYDLKVDEDAVGGENEIELRYYEGDSLSGTYISEDFNISVEDLRVDFETSITGYDYSSNEMEFEILNTGEHDVEALTIEIPQQESVDLKEPPRKIVGPLDKEDETTFKYQLSPVLNNRNKSKIDLDITYTDGIQERRNDSASVKFDKKYFPEEKSSGLGDMSVWFYLFMALLVLIILGWFWKRHKKKKEAEEEEDND